MMMPHVQVHLSSGTHTMGQSLSSLTKTSRSKVASNTSSDTSSAKFATPICLSRHSLTKNTCKPAKTAELADKPSLRWKRAKLKIPKQTTISQAIVPFSQAESAGQSLRTTDQTQRPTLVTMYSRETPQLPHVKRMLMESSKDLPLGESKTSSKHFKEAKRKTIAR